MSDSKAAEAKPLHPVSTARHSDIELIRELAHLLAETELTEIEISEGDKRFKVKREITMTAAPAYMAAPAPVAAAPAAASAAPAAAPANDANAMTSPMVGTAYLAPKPGDPAFVKVGDSVKEGQTVMIIEAMKVMNPIKATKSGTVTAIFVKDADPIEFGQKLMVIA